MGGELEVGGSQRGLAERNEELNRRRLERGGTAGGGGPLRVTDPAALARLMAELHSAAEHQREVEQTREAQRAQREGAAYKPPEQRAAEARAAAAAAAAAGCQEGEARALEGKLDASKDYYAALEVERCASAAEIKKAYKRLAMLYHPDKHKAATPEQQGAVSDRFRAVAEAFDVLSNEAQRAVYDKLRDYQERNPGWGLPPLSPEEAALVRAGVAELARMRRAGAKLAKHGPRQQEVWVSLPKLNSGCTKSVEAVRRRVEADGRQLDSAKTFHLVIRRGSSPGDRLTMEAEGDETVDTHPGDMVFVLRQKPHPTFQRRGEKDLETFAGCLDPGTVRYAVEVEALSGRRLLLHGSALRETLLAGGVGGTLSLAVQGQGLYHPGDPWEKPPGDLWVELRRPPVLLPSCTISSCLAPRPVWLLGSASDPVAASLVGGMLAARLAREQEAKEMAVEESGNSSSTGEGQQLQAVCLRMDAFEGSSSAGSGSSSGCSAAAAALLRVLKARVPGTAVRTVRLGIEVCHCHGTAGCAPTSSSSSSSSIDSCCCNSTQGSTECLLDDEWSALKRAAVIILDVGLPQQQQQPANRQRQQSAEQQAKAEEQQQQPAALEAALAAAWRALHTSGLLALLIERYWEGASVVGLGPACALLGQQPPPGCSGCVQGGAGGPLLPWYALRAGSESREGWAQLYAAAGSARAGTTAVGVLAGGAWAVHPLTGMGELLVAPPRDSLVASAQWAAAHAASAAAAAAVEEGEEDYGFFVSLRSK